MYLALMLVFFSVPSSTVSAIMLQQNVVLGQTALDYSNTTLLYLCVLVRPHRRKFSTANGFAD